MLWGSIKHYILCITKNTGTFYETITIEYWRFLICDCQWWIVNGQYSIFNRQGSFKDWGYSCRIDLSCKKELIIAKRQKPGDKEGALTDTKTALIFFVDYHLKGELISSFFWDLSKQKGKDSIGGTSRVKSISLWI